MATGARPNPILLFVYGSLLSGERDHDLLATAKPLGPARTPPEYYLVDLGAYPALVRGGTVAVVGETYEVAGALLLKIDRRKEHPALFQRATIALADGAKAEAYLMQQEQVRGRRRLKTGDFRQRFAPYKSSAPENPWARWARGRTDRR